ncbi:MAG: LacI family DNA-binding transcriptional regulator [Christensenellales bacterium]
MAVTVRDIARQAGVSPATVSLVINNRKGVSEATRRRVQEVLHTQQYRTLPSGRSQQRFRLEIVKYRAHGMAVEENQGFIASIIDQIEQECGRQAIRVGVGNCDAQKVGALISQINADPPDGIILVGTELPRSDCAWLKTLKAPLVVLDNSMRFQEWDSVVMDNQQIARSAVHHLYGLGHRRIDYFKSAKQIDNLDERYLGYLQALHELGLPAPPPTLLTLTLNGAYKDMKQLIAQGQYTPRGAAFADNDSIAIGAAKAIQEAGYDIPGDLSIVGVDDIPFSAMMMPPLTTVRISRSALGILALELLHKRINHPQWPPMQLCVAGSLVPRDSVQAADAKKES